MAQKQYMSLSRFIRQQINRSFEELEENPYHEGVVELYNFEGYRKKVGDYRILFTVDDEKKELIVYRVKHRSDAYK
ncbi:MAG: hypothetical protein IEMM0008_1455 [bacterium]|nr:MAG: hypothetical protein IEMM0008_1455 [bacterium]